VSAVIDTIKSFTPEQQAERRNFIGGSEAAAAIGLDKYRPAFDVWQEKIGEAPPFEGNEATLWGKLLEPIIRQQYAERTGNVVRLPEETIRHPSLSFMGCHPDGVIGDSKIYEGKCSRFGDEFGEEGSDEVPERYLIQCQHNMFVLGADLTDLAVLVGGNELRIYHIRADKGLQQAIAAAEDSFWRNVKARTPPAIDTQREDTMKVLARMYPQTTGDILNATTQDEEAYAQWQAAQAQTKFYDELAKAEKAKLAARIGGGAMVTFSDGKALRRKLIEKDAYTVEASSYWDYRLVNAPGASKK